MNNNPTVEILMSTYNGTKYLNNQIKSIFEQKDVEVHLSIRDDGSDDDTVEIIKKISKTYPGKISLYQGENIGYSKSFLKLLHYANDADYYAFSDQDDYWKSDKLKAAINCLKHVPDDIKLYVSSVENVDENMIHIGIHDISNVIPTLEAAFTRNRYTGCTFLFSKKLKKLGELFSDLNPPLETMPSHDFLVAVLALALGKVYYDTNSYVYHIRRQKSVTSGGNLLLKRIKIEYNSIFHRKHMAKYTANQLLNNLEYMLNDETKSFLNDIINYNNNLMSKFKLLTNNKMKSGIKLCDIECKLKILIGQY